MKRKKGVDVDQKVIILYLNGVSEEIKNKVQKQYPHALVKPVRADEVIKEAVAYRKKVNRIIYMPEVGRLQAEGASEYWPGSTVSAIEI